MTLPDILGEAKARLACASGAKVTVLSPGRGDFRLDGIAPEAASVDFGAGFEVTERRGTLYAALGNIWYTKAVDAWNALEVPRLRTLDADAQMCVSLLAREAEPQPPSAEEKPLIRAAMEAPHLLANRPSLVEPRARAWAAQLRAQRARALAVHGPLWALRGCAAMILWLILLGRMGEHERGTDGTCGLTGRVRGGSDAGGADHTRL